MRLDSPFFQSSLLAGVVCISAVGLVGAAAAQTTGSVPNRSEPQERRIYDAEDFRRAFEGRTVELVDRLGRPYGAEQYFPGDRTIWVADNGGCVDGLWYVRGGYVCFEYPQSGPHCWLVYDEGDATFVVSDDGLLLQVSDIHDRPLQCEPQLMSALDGVRTPGG